MHSSTRTVLTYYEHAVHVLHNLFVLLLLVSGEIVYTMGSRMQKESVKNTVFLFIVHFVHFVLDHSLLN